MYSCVCGTFMANYDDLDKIAAKVLANGKDLVYTELLPVFC